MDPLSLVTLGFQIVTMLHNVVESLREAPEALSDFLSRTRSLHIMLQRLDKCKDRLDEDQKRTLNGMWDEGRCRATVETLHRLVLKIAVKNGDSFREGVLTRVQWVLQKSTAENMAERLQIHKQDIISTLVVLSFESNLSTEKQLADVSDQVRLESSRVSDEIALQTQPTKVLEDIDVNKAVTMATGKQVWHGSTIREYFPTDKLVLRDELANTAYGWRWTKVFELLVQARDLTSYCWANCWRLVPSERPSSLRSGWTPLHQAACCGASVEVVEKLLSLGAWRTLTTNREQLTPREVADEYGHSHLSKILSPVIHHYLPANTLLSLQMRFHALILELADNAIITLQMRLPELCVLTELPSPDMWFELNYADLLFHFRLDTRVRQLLVRCYYCVSKHADSRVWRISEDETVRIDTAVVLGPGIGRG